MRGCHCPTCRSWLPPAQPASLPLPNPTKRVPSRASRRSFIFHKYDIDRSGGIDEEELALCFSELAVRVNGRQRKTKEEVREWVQREFKRNDKNKDGQLSFDEFVEYYNKFISHSRRSFEDTYKITEHLGKGAFASVKKATVLHPTEGMADDVAVKVVKKAGVNMNLLHNEISIWSMLTHKHLVRLYDAFETPDELMLVTELMRGGDLFERLRDIESFDEVSAQDLAAQIVSGVAYLHSHGVVHCDLKPSNILVVEPLDARSGGGSGGGAANGSSAGKAAPVGSLTVKLADFGLSQTLQRSNAKALVTSPARRAKALSIDGRGGGGGEDGAAAEMQTALDMAGIKPGERGTARDVEEGDAFNLTDVCGTPEYFAPELVALSQAGSSDGGGYDAKVDCWACGCIVYAAAARTPTPSNLARDGCPARASLRSAWQCTAPPLAPSPPLPRGAPSPPSPELSPAHPSPLPPLTLSLQVRVADGAAAVPGDNRRRALLQDPRQRHPLPARGLRHALGRRQAAHPRAHRHRRRRPSRRRRRALTAVARRGHQRARPLVGARPREGQGAAATAEHAAGVGRVARGEERLRRRGTRRGRRGRHDRRGARGRGCGARDLTEGRSVPGCLFQSFFLACGCPLLQSGLGTFPDACRSQAGHFAARPVARMSCQEPQGEHAEHTLQ